MRDIREVTPEDIAYQEYIGKLIDRAKRLSEAGIDTTEQRRIIKSIIEYIRVHDYLSADYLIQIIEEDLKRNFSQYFPVEPKATSKPRDDEKKDEKPADEACVSYLKRPLRAKPFFVGSASRLVAVSLVFVLLSGSLAWASNRALPGDYLYPVKRAVEKTSLLLAPGPEAKAELLARFSETRLAEARSLVARGNTGLAKQALKEMREGIEAGLAQAGKAGGKSGIIARLQINLASHQKLLAGLMAKAPKAAQKDLEKAVGAPERGLSQAQSSVGKETVVKSAPVGKGSSGKGSSKSKK